MNDDDIDIAADEPATVDAADNAVRRTRADTAKRLEDEELAAWRDFMGKPAGRRALWKLLESCGTFRERFACGPNGFPQPEATWFHAGEQSVGLRLYKFLSRISRAAVFSMHDELDHEFAEPVKPKRKPR